MMLLYKFAFVENKTINIFFQFKERFAPFFNMLRFYELPFSPFFSLQNNLIKNETANMC